MFYFSESRISASVEIPSKQHSNVIRKLQVLTSVGDHFILKQSGLPPQDLIGEDVSLCDVPVVDMFGRRAKGCLKVESLEMFSQR